MSLGSFCRGGPMWSPEGNRLAIYDGHDLAIYDGHDLAILDVVTDRQQRIPLGSAFMHGPAWSPDGTLIVVGDGLIDAVTGQIIRGPKEDPSFSLPSHDHQWLALRTGPEVCGTTRPPLPPPPGDPAWETRNVRPADLNNGNRLVIQSVKDPDRHVVFDCDGSSYSAREWLPNNKLLVVGLAEGCGETICRPPPGALWLVSPDGQKQLLTAGEESGSQHQVSRDGSRILVGGARLRIYSADGVLEREITPPPGRIVTGAAWAPDGSSFAYTVGPRLQGLKYVRTSLAERFDYASAVSSSSRWASSHLA